MVIPDYVLSLAEHGVEILIEPFIENKGTENEINHGLCIAVGGFYKNSKIHLVRNGGLNDFVSCLAIGRYGHLENVVSLEDMVSLNYKEWRRYEGKGFTIDPMWADLLEKYGYIKKVVETKYIPIVGNRDY